MTSVVEREEHATRTSLERVTKLSHVAADLMTRDSDDLAARLREVVAEEVAVIPALRVSVAALVLGLDEKTVRSWVEAGVLEAVEVKPRLLISPESVWRVYQLVGQLREAGQRRGLLDAVWRRLTDAETFADPLLRESLEQMRRGELVAPSPRPVWADEPA